MLDFKPMLASNIKVEKVRLPAYGSRKMEGIRAEFTPQGLFTRPLKRFNNKLVEELFDPVIQYCKYSNVTLEGELYIHGIGFSELSSIVRRNGHHGTDGLNLFIFDALDHQCEDDPFGARIQVIKRSVADIDMNNVMEAPQIMHRDHDSIRDAYTSAVDAGYEGWCLKSPYGRYKYGRSTANEQLFCRIKPENTYDGVVLEIIERMENLCESEENELGYLSKKQDKDMKAPTGMAAVAIVDCKDFNKPVRVSLSRNIMDLTNNVHSPSRQVLWTNRESYIGKHIRFVGLPIPGMDLPRSPRFDAWRTDLD